jgi:mRNA-degrading endonuclease RelE of RelBE toxin-antitoxin system
MVMVRRAPFAIHFDAGVKEHMEAIEKKYHSIIREHINQQLLHDPDVETRNRKRLLREVAFAAKWELRFGPDNRFRVFYSIDLVNRVVLIMAVGIKQGSKLFIGGQEINL